MFSLIITIISIALVAGLAVATLFFGGDAFLMGKTDAETARYINESQQIAGAIRMYQADNQGALPGDLNADLVDFYLKQMPQSGVDWDIGDGAIVKQVNDAETCENVNERAGWTNPNYPADTSLNSQYSPASCDDASLDGQTYYCCTVTTAP